MKIINALPRRMTFKATATSSIELCIAEWTAGSRYRNETTIVAERGENPLLDVDILRLTPVKRLSSWHLAYAIRQRVRARGCDLILTQQHIATAARIAAFSPQIPVILQTHNFIESPRVGPGSKGYNLTLEKRLNRMAGMTMVSEAAKRRFEAEWPKVTVPRIVVTHGSDFTSWHPAVQREKLIIVIGRLADIKGILESAQGISSFLAKFEDWRAVFALSEPQEDKDKSYLRAVEQVLQPVKARVDLLFSIPFTRVRELTEKAAISIVASKWDEPFGRTGVEAHAGGAALISSGTGGLREISGDYAVYLEKVTGPNIAAALFKLGSDDAFRERMAQEGMRRVRRLFSLTRKGADEGSDVVPLCERLDNFYDEVVANWNKDRVSGAAGLHRSL